MKSQGWLLQLNKSLFSGLLAMLLTLTVPWLAMADTITVTTTADEFNTNPGACSVREAIQAANTNAAFGGCTAGAAGMDTINLAANTYTLSIAGSVEDNNTTGDLDVKTDTAGVLLNGMGATSNMVVIDANGIDRVIQAAIGVALHLNNLTIRGGDAAGSSGGGVFFGGTASVTGTIFLNNTTFGGEGGGATFAGTTNVTGTTFSGNSASVGGGANFIGATSAKQLVNVLFARNWADMNGAAVNVFDANPLRLIHTTIVSPTEPTGGATEAIYIFAGTVYVTNTIIASHTRGIERQSGTVEEDYNLFSDVPTPFEGTVGHGTNNSITAATATFADETTYKLGSLSAALDAGTNLGITTDYFGTVRPLNGGYDMGYAEYNLASSVAVMGGSAGENSGPLVFTVSLNVVSANAVTFTYQTQDGTATAGSDYTAIAPTQVVIPAGNMAATINVNLLGDSLYELNETIMVSLSNIMSGTLLTGVATGTIVNDDTIPLLTLAVGSRLENSGSLPFTMSLNATSGLPVTFTYETQDGTATTGNSDYTAIGATQGVIPAGSLALTGNVTVIDDSNYELNETVGVSLSNVVHAAAGTWVATATIQNDEPAPAMVIAPGGSSTTEAGGTVTFSVRLSTEPLFPVTIAISSSDTTEGTVSAASLSFNTADWSTPQVVTVMGVDDSLYDPSTAYQVTIGSLTSSDTDYSGLASQNLNLTNSDNEPLPAMTVVSGGSATSEAGGTVTFSVRLSTQPTAGVSVAISTTDITEGTVSATSLNFTTGNWATPQVVTVTGVDDVIADPGMAYQVTIGPLTSSDTDYSGLASQNLNLTNTDNDVPPNAPPTISNLTTPVVMTEDMPLTVTYTVADDFTAAAQLVAVISFNNNTTLFPPANIVLGGTGSNHTIKLTPAANRFGTAFINVSVSDGSVSNYRQVMIQVAPQNDAPTLVQTPPMQTAVSGTPFSYTIPLTAFADIDGDNLTLQVTDLPTWLTYNSATRLLQGTPTANDVSQQSLVVTAVDPLSASVETTLAIEVKLNQPYFTTLPLPSAVTDQLYQGNIVVENPLGLNGLVISSLQLPLWLTLTDLGQGKATLSGTPSAAQVGQYPVSFKATNQAGVAITHTLTIQVSNLADMPKFTSVPLTSAKQDAAYLYKVTAMSPLNSALSLSALSKPPWLDFRKGTNGQAELTGTPVNGQEGSYQVILMVQDAIGQITLQEFTIGVQNVNDLPTITSTPIETTFQGELYQYPMTATDIDAGATLTFGGTNLPAWLTVQSTGNSQATLRGTPDNADVGSHELTVWVNDGVATVEQSFSLKVINVNEPPQLQRLPALQATEDVTFTQVFSLSDPDMNEVFNLAAPSLPQWLTLIQVDTYTLRLEGMPTNDNVGQQTINVAVRDSGGEVDSIQTTITVANSNDAPLITSYPLNTASQNALYRYQIEISDDDATDQLTVTADQVPSWLTMTQETTLNNQPGSTLVATLVGTPTTFELSEQTIRLTVRDMAGESASQTYTLTVVSQPPIALEDTAETVGTAPITIAVLANDADPEGVAITLVSVNQPAHGTTSLGNGFVTYQASDSFTGTDTFSYTISDGSANVSAAVRVTVIPPNSAPVAQADNVIAFSGYQIGLNVLANDSDADGDALALVAVGKSSRGAVILWDKSQNSLTYRGPVGFVGADNFSYTIQDKVEHPLLTPKMVTGQVTVDVRDITKSQADLALERPLSTPAQINQGLWQTMVSRFELKNLADQPAGKVRFTEQFAGLTAAQVQAYAVAPGGSCSGNQPLVCTFEVIAPNETVVITTTMTVRAEQMGDLISEAKLTSLSVDTNSDNNQQNQTITVKEVTPLPVGSLKIVANNYDTAAADQVKVTGNIQLGDYFQWAGLNASLEVNPTTNQIVGLQGTLQDSQGQLIFEGQMVADAQTGQLIPQAGKTLLSKIGLFSSSNIIVTGVDLLAGKVSGTGLLDLRRGALVAQIPVAFSSTGAQQVTGQSTAASVINYGDGKRLSIQEVTGRFVQKSGQSLFMGQGVLQLTLAGETYRMPNFAFELAVDGTITTPPFDLPQLKLLPSKGLLAWTSVQLDNQGLTASQTLYLVVGLKTGPLKTIRFTADGFSKLADQQVEVSNGGTSREGYYIREQKAGSSESYTLDKAPIAPPDYVLNLPQNHRTIKNFDYGIGRNSSVVTNSDIVLDVANTRLIAKNPYLKDGVLTARGAEWIFPKQLGSVKCTTDEEVKLVADLQAPCSLSELDDFYNFLTLKPLEDDADELDIEIKNLGSYYKVVIKGQAATSDVASDLGFKAEIDLTVDNSKFVRGKLRGAELNIVGFNAKVSQAEFAEGTVSAAEVGLYLPSPMFEKDLGSVARNGQGGVSVYNLEVKPKTGSVMPYDVKIGGGKFALPTIPIGGLKLFSLMGELKPVPKGGYDISAGASMKIGGATMGDDCRFNASVTIRWDKGNKRQMMDFKLLHTPAELNIVTNSDEKLTIPLNAAGLRQLQESGLSQPISSGAQPLSLDLAMGRDPRSISLKQISLGISGCEIELQKEVVFLTDASGTFTISDGYVEITIAAAIAVGRPLPVLGLRPLSAEASVTLSVPYKDKKGHKYPWNLAFEGRAKLFEKITLGRVTLDANNGGVGLGLKINPFIPITRLTADANMWWGQGTGFNFTASGDLGLGITAKQIWSVLPNVGFETLVRIELGKFRVPGNGTAWGVKGRVTGPIRSPKPEQVVEVQERVEDKEVYEDKEVREQVRSGREMINAFDEPNQVLAATTLIGRQPRGFLDDVIRVANVTVDGAVKFVTKVVRVLVAIVKVIVKIAVAVWKILTFDFDIGFYADSKLNVAFGGDVDKYQLVTRNRVREAYQAQQPQARSQDSNGVSLDVDPDLTFLTLPEAGRDARQTRQQAVAVDVNVTQPTTMTVYLDSSATGPDMALVGPDGTTYNKDNLPANIEFKEWTTYKQAAGQSVVTGLKLGQMRFVNAIADGPAVEVWVNDERVVNSLAFTQTSLYNPFTLGTYTVKFMAGGAVLAETTVQIGVGSEYTLVATGSAGAVWALSDDNSSRGDKSAYLRLVHVGSGVGAVTLKETLGPGLFSNVGYQRSSSYYGVYGGSHNLDLFKVTGEPLVSLPQVQLNEGEIYTLFVFNGANGVQATVQRDAISPSYLKPIHLAGDLSGVVLQLDNVTFSAPLSVGQGLSETIAMPAGQYAVKLLHPTTKGMLYQSSISVSTFSHAAWVMYNQNGQFKSKLVESAGLPAVGESRLQFVHLAHHTGQVDLYLQRQEAPELLLAGNIAFNGQTAAIDLPPSAKYYQADKPEVLLGRESMTVILRVAGSSQTLAQFPILALDAGSSHTLYFYQQGSELRLLDDVTEQALVQIERAYTVAKPQVGKWQVKLEGDVINSADYRLEISAPKAKPELSDADIVMQNGQQTLQWRLKSGQPETSVQAMYKTSPLLETTVITDENGVAHTVEAMVYTGRAVTAPLTAPTNPAWIDGTLQQHAIETAMLPSGTYYVYLEADDMANEFVRQPIAKPLVIEHIWPQTWQSDLSVKAAGYRRVAGTWMALANPDVQEYELRWQSTLTNIVYSETVDATYQPIGAISATATTLSPGESYHFTVIARNYDKGLESTSESVLITVGGAEFTMTALDSLPAIQAGQSATMTLRVSALDASYPEEESVGLYSGPSSNGLYLDFEPSLVMPTITGTDVIVTVSSNGLLPSGQLTATILASGGGTKQSLELATTIIAPSFALSTDPLTITLDENGETQVAITPERLNGHILPIRLDMVTDLPLDWSFYPTELTDNQTATLTLRDTPLTGSGMYTITLNGQDEGGPANTTLTRTLIIRKPAFTLSGTNVISMSGEVSQTFSIPLTVTFQDGWASPVNLMVETANAPFGITFGFEPSQRQADLTDFMVTADSTNLMLTVNVSAEAAEGVYLLPVIATSNGRQLELDVLLQVGSQQLQPDRPRIYLPIIYKK